MPPKENLLKQRIFVGFNSAGAAGIWNYTRDLRRRGIKIDFYGMDEVRLGMRVDFLLKFSENPLRSFFERFFYFLKILPKYGIWHFNFLEAFFFYPLNLLILKLLGKKIVLTFRGAEVRTGVDFLPKEVYAKASPNRWPEYYQRIYSPEKKRQNFFKKLRMKIFVHFADKVVLTGPFSAGQVSRYDRIIPYAREVNEIRNLPAGKAGFIKKSSKKITILHVPSEPIVKGTPEIKKIFKKLQKKYSPRGVAGKNVDFRILPIMPREQLLQEMAESDIIIDQIILGWYGGQAVEAMAMGKIVLAYLHAPYLAMVEYGKEIPIWNTNPWSLENDLENLIKMYPQFAEDFQERAVKFAQKYHSSEKIADQYLDIYRSVQ